VKGIEFGFEKFSIHLLNPESDHFFTLIAITNLNYANNMCPIPLSKFPEFNKMHACPIDTQPEAILLFK